MNRTGAESGDFLSGNVRGAWAERICLASQEGSESLVRREWPDARWFAAESCGVRPGMRDLVGGVRYWVIRSGCGVRTGGVVILCR